MQNAPIEMTTEECLELLHAGHVGRVAMATPMGPRIVPVDYAMHDGALVLATTPYTELGTYGVDTVLAFEIDHLDEDRRSGWSVVALGRSSRLRDTDQVLRRSEQWQASPWLAGRRPLYLQLRWRELAGRRIGIA